MKTVFLLAIIFCVFLIRADSRSLNDDELTNVLKLVWKDGGRGNNSSGNARTTAVPEYGRIRVRSVNMRKDYLGNIHDARHRRSIVKATNAIKTTSDMKKPTHVKDKPTPLTSQTNAPGNQSIISVQEKAELINLKSATENIKKLAVAILNRKQPMSKIPSIVDKDHLMNIKISSDIILAELGAMDVDNKETASIGNIQHSADDIVHMLKIKAQVKNIESQFQDIAKRGLLVKGDEATKLDEGNEIMKIKGAIHVINTISGSLNTNAKKIRPPFPLKDKTILLGIGDAVETMQKQMELSAPTNSSLNTTPLENAYLQRIRDALKIVRVQLRRIDAEHRKTGAHINGTLSVEDRTDLVKTKMIVQDLITIANKTLYRGTNLAKKIISAGKESSILRMKSAIESLQSLVRSVHPADKTSQVTGMPNTSHSEPQVVTDGKQELVTSPITSISTATDATTAKSATPITKRDWMNPKSIRQRPAVKSLRTVQKPNKRNHKPVRESNNTTEGKHEALPKPVVLLKPGALQKNETLQKPGELQKTETLQKPGELQKTETLQKPGELQKTETLKKLLQTTEATEKPAALQKPGASEKPAALQKPGASEKPAALQKPGASEKPGEIQKPEAVEKTKPLQKPEKLDKPGALEKPGKLDKPGALQKANKPKPSKPSVTKPSTNKLAEKPHNGVPKIFLKASSDITPALERTGLREVLIVMGLLKKGMHTLGTKLDSHFRHLFDQNTDNSNMQRTDINTNSDRISLLDKDLKERIDQMESKVLNSSVAVDSESTSTNGNSTNIGLKQKMDQFATKLMNASLAVISATSNVTNSTDKKLKTTIEQLENKVLNSSLAAASAKATEDNSTGTKLLEKISQMENKLVNVSIAAASAKPTIESSTTVSTTKRSTSELPTTKDTSTTQKPLLIVLQQTTKSPILVVDNKGKVVEDSRSENPSNPVEILKKVLQTSTEPGATLPNHLNRSNPTVKSSAGVTNVPESNEESSPVPKGSQASANATSTKDQNTQLKSKLTAASSIPPNTMVKDKQDSSSANEKKTLGSSKDAIKVNQSLTTKDALNKTIINSSEVEANTPASNDKDKIQSPTKKKTNLETDDIATKKSSDSSPTQQPAVTNCTTTKSLVPSATGAPLSEASAPGKQVAPSKVSATSSPADKSASKDKESGNTVKQETPSKVSATSSPADKSASKNKESGNTVKQETPSKVSATSSPADKSTSKDKESGNTVKQETPSKVSATSSPADKSASENKESGNTVKQETPSKVSATSSPADKSASENKESGNTVKQETPSKVSATSSPVDKSASESKESGNTVKQETPSKVSATSSPADKSASESKESGNTVKQETPSKVSATSSPADKSASESKESGNTVKQETPSKVSATSSPADKSASESKESGAVKTMPVTTSASLIKNVSESRPVPTATKIKQLAKQLEQKLALSRREDKRRKLNGYKVRRNSHITQRDDRRHNNGRHNPNERRGYRSFSNYNRYKSHAAHARPRSYGRRHQGEYAR